MPAPLTADTVARSPWYTIRAQADARHAELLIYHEIGESWWGDTVSAAAFVEELRALDVDTIDLRLNSPGGSVFDGHAIYNALRRHKAKVTTYIDGFAASIASIVALAGERVVIAPNAVMMIHNPWSWAIGDATEMRRTADLLDKLQTTLVNVYAEHTGQERDAIVEAMNAETWYTADEAVAFGLADEVDTEDDAPVVAAYASPQVVARFRHAPPQVAAMLRTTPAPSAKESDAPDETDAPGMVTTNTAQAALAVLLP